MTTDIDRRLRALMAPAAFDGAFEPIHVAHAGSFALNAAPEEAFPWFTAPGETLWVPNWDPVILNGDGTEQGTVFVTSHGDETTIWVVVDFDPGARRARYARITPGSRAGTVEVRVRKGQRSGSTVEVRYALTALSEAGNANLAAFDEDAYGAMLETWRELIRTAGLDG